MRAGIYKQTDTLKMYQEGKMTQQHPDSYGYTDDVIAGLQLEATRHKKARGKANHCEDCGQPTPNIGYCDECNLRHRLVFNDGNLAGRK